MWNLSKTYLPLLATASLLTLAACSTIDEDVPAPPSEEPAAVLNINILAPRTITTRAEDREVAATDNENMLHDIRVWAYKSSTAADRDNDLPVGYAEVANANSYGYTKTESGGTTTYMLNPYTMTMLLPVSMYSNEEQTTLYPMDFYVMANTKQLSTLTSLPEMPARKALREASFGHVGTNDDYGLTGTPVNIASETNGLPISQIVSNVTVNPNPEGQNLLYKNNDPIELTRAISKVQFFFARTTGVEGVNIRKIEIDGSAFPTTQYIFPVENPSGYGNVMVANLPASVTYENGNNIVYGDGTNAIVGGEGNPINSLTDPTSLFKKDDESFQTYVNRMNTYATPYGLTYLRETDKKLTGRIYYSVGGTPVDTPAEFILENEGDFSRNHSWFVYGYFSGSRLELTVTVLDWTLKQSELVFTDHPSADTPFINWQTNTYNTKDDDNHEIVLLANGTTPAVCTFKINTPVGFPWTAILESDDDEPFCFVDENGNVLGSTVSGDVGSSSTLRIRPTTAQVSSQKKAKLEIIVLMQSKYINMSSLGDEFKSWTIIQDYNQ